MAPDDVTASADEELPRSIGIIGVGTISAAIVRGFCSPGGPSPTPSFVLSPRGAAKSKALAEAFPEAVRIAVSNQEVVDAAECIVLGVLPKQAEQVLAGLKFREGQRVISLVSSLRLQRLRELVDVPGLDCARAVPLPAVAKRRGTSTVMPPRPFARAIFSVLGTCIAVEDEGHLMRMQVATAIMGDFYKRQLTLSHWLAGGGIPEAQAAELVGGIYATVAADGTGKPGSKTFEELVAEQTPGGLNEQLLKEQEADGSYEAMRHSLDGILHRLRTGAADPDLAPAVKRGRTS